MILLVLKLVYNRVCTRLSEHNSVSMTITLIMHESGLGQAMQEEEKK